MSMISRIEIDELVWTRAIVRDRIKEAAYNLRRMPPLTDRDRPAQYRIVSLERNYRPAFDDAFAAAVEEVGEKGKQDAPPVRLGPPDAIAIDRMYEVLDWLMWLNKTQKRIVFCKAIKKGGLLPRQYRCDRTTINRWHNHTLDMITRRLTVQGVRVREAEE